MTVLEGAEKNKAVATALSSEDYKNVKKMLPASVYAPSIERAQAGIINLELNGTKYEGLVVFVPFEAGAGFSAGIVFMIIESHAVAMGVVVNLQSETPIFAAMSMDGKAIVIPLRAGGSCCSCSLSGSGVSPMVDQCSGDSDCWNLYGPDYCCVDGRCIYCECWSDYDCQQKYGSGYCCVNHQCAYCGSLPPIYDEYAFCLFACFILLSVGCLLPFFILAFFICGYFCLIYPEYCWECITAAYEVIEHVCLEFGWSTCEELCSQWYH
jgi:hypothetical protein